MKKLAESKQLLAKDLDDDDFDDWNPRDHTFTDDEK